MDHTSAISMHCHDLWWLKQNCSCTTHITAALTPLPVWEIGTSTLCLSPTLKRKESMGHWLRHMPRRARTWWPEGVEAHRAWPPRPDEVWKVFYEGHLAYACVWMALLQRTHLFVSVSGAVCLSACCLAVLFSSTQGWYPRFPAVGYNRSCRSWSFDSRLSLPLGAQLIALWLIRQLHYTVEQGFYVILGPWGPEEKSREVGNK